MFKNYLEEKEKQFDVKSQTDKQVARMKLKGSQKQFEHYAMLDTVLDKIKAEIHPKQNRREAGGAGKGLDLQMSKAD